MNQVLKHLLRNLSYRFQTVIDVRTVKRFARLATAALAVWVIDTVILFLAEPPSVNQAFHGVGDYFWGVILYLFSGVSDYAPRTATGRVVAGTALVSAVAFAALFTAELVALVVELGRRRGIVPTKPDGRFSGHVVVCNWPRNGSVVVRNLHSDEYLENRPVVLVAEDTEMLRQSEVSAGRHSSDFIWKISADASTPTALTLANIESAAAILILAQRQQPTSTGMEMVDPQTDGFHTSINPADARSLLVALVARRLNKSVPISVELLDEHDRGHFELAGVDQIVSVETISAKLMAQAVLEPGLTGVFGALLTCVDDTAEPYFYDVDERLEGTTFGEFRKLAARHRVIPVGLRDRTGHLTMNPPLETAVAHGCKIVALGQNASAVRSMLSAVTSELGALGG